MATTQYQILTRAQRIARRFGKKEPEVSYQDGNGKAIVVVDPTRDVIEDEPVVEVEQPKRRGRKKKEEK